MRILGIDPGYAIIGYGIIDFFGGKYKTLSYGAITTSSDTPFTKRLELIYDELELIIAWFLCHFMKTQMKSNISVKLHFMNTSKF